METPILVLQEIPYDSEESCNMFQPGPEKPFVATPAAIESYSREVIIACLRILQDQSERNNGLDYLQVFKTPMSHKEDLWFMEDGPGGAITALLPSDH